MLKLFLKLLMGILLLQLLLLGMLMLGILLEMILGLLLLLLMEMLVKLVLVGMLEHAERKPVVSNGRSKQQKRCHNVFPFHE